MPTTFSTALPAMATMTSPVNASESPSAAIVGVRTPTNHSETKAAPTPAAASVARGGQRGQGGGGGGGGGQERPGRVRLARLLARRRRLEHGHAAAPVGADDGRIALER